MSISKKTLATKTLDDGKILAWDTALKFILAGRAIVTLEDVKDSARSTYLVEQAVDEKKNEQTGEVEKIRRERWFVSLLVGSDNTKSYKYLGCVDKKKGTLAFRTTAGTKKNKFATAENINRFGDVIHDLVAGVDNSHVTRVWHRGFCGHCAKPLTVPASIATGFGPVCSKKLGIEMANVEPSAIEKLGALAVAEMNEPEPVSTKVTAQEVIKKACAVPAEEPKNEQWTVAPIYDVPAEEQIDETPKVKVETVEAPVTTTSAKKRLSAVLKKLNVCALDLESEDITSLLGAIDAVEKLASLAKPKRSLKDLLNQGAA